MLLVTTSVATHGIYYFIMNHDNYENVYDPDNLIAAYKAARKGSAWKGQVQKYGMDYLLNLRKLQKELEADTYKDGDKNEFILRERGKTRLIRAATFKDRVARHSLCDNVLTPILAQKLIYDNCASLKGRGVDMARRRLKVHLQRYYRRYKTNEGYILLMDFSGFYDNIRHDKLMEYVKQYVNDKRVLALTQHIVDGFSEDVSFLADAEIKKLYYGKFKALDFAQVPSKVKTGEKYMRKGMDIGDQCSQILSVFYPTPIDNYIKIVEGEKFYARYMDDSYIISPDKARLKHLLEKIKEIAAGLGIFINERKTRIVKISKTFRYMQNKYFITPTGKVVERANTKRITCMRRKLKRLARLIKEHRTTYEAAEMMFRSWKGNYYRIMSRAQRRNMDKVFNNTIGGFKNVTL